MLAMADKSRRQVGRRIVTELTPEMIRAGVKAYYAWNEEEEEPERLVAAIFFALREAKAQARRE